ncbi:ketopantoate reductase family protein [Paraglaciecola sp.]|uniref:ketopantoate reductase family protein n=1 Tax=Paraglaciecola sp. TaxID=1920173 RepID=UPI003EF632C0
MVPLSLSSDTQSKNSLKIAIIGQGAIGGLLASQCHNLGYNYQLLLRNKTLVKPNFSLQIEDIRQQVTQIQPKTCQIDQAKNFDLLILPIKAYQVLAALKSMQKNIQPHQVIVLLHNGMGTIEQVKQLLPDNPCVAATTSYGAFKPAPAYVKQTGLGETHLGWINSPEPEQVEEIEKILTNLLPPSSWHQDITIALWNKLTINAVINPLTAIHNIKNGELNERKYTGEIEKTCSEICSIMQQLNYSVQLKDLLKRVNQVIEKTANNYSSMHQDIYHGRKTEIEYINGYVVQKGKELGVGVKANQELFNQIKALEKKQ